MDNRELYKLSDWKNLVEIGCKCVFANKDKINDFGTEVVKEEKKKNRRLCFEQSQYLEKAVIRFAMYDEEHVYVSLAMCFKHSGIMIPSTYEVVKYITQLLNGHTVENLTDAIVCT